MNPENTDYMFVAPSMRAAGKFLSIPGAKAYRYLSIHDADSQIGSSSSPSILQTGKSNATKIGGKQWQKKLVERGKMWTETSRSRPRSDVGSL